jgi:hypothetical protein
MGQTTPATVCQQALNAFLQKHAVDPRHFIEVLARVRQQSGLNARETTELLLNLEDSAAAMVFRSRGEQAAPCRRSPIAGRPPSGAVDPP